MSSGAVERTDVRIVSQFHDVWAWLYRPAPNNSDGEFAHEQRPAIVMAHGFSAVKEMGLDRFATAFAEAGYVVCVFDHPNFGASGGPVPQEIDPQRQLVAYRSVLTWVSRLDDVDEHRLGVWGTSFSGGHALTLAATEPMVRCAVAQVPYVRPPADDAPDDLIKALQMDEEQRRIGGSPLMIPVVSAEADGFGALDHDPTAYGWLMTHAERAPSWRNEVTLRSLAHVFMYQPDIHAPDVVAPLLFVAAVDDQLTPLIYVRHAAAVVAAPHDLVELEGGHFDVYDRQFGTASAAALGWFDRWLAPTDPG